jgi:hypothetical protein
MTSAGISGTENKDFGFHERLWLTIAGNGFDG